jgi:hypothetical protein
VPPPPLDGTTAAPKVVAVTVVVGLVDRVVSKVLLLPRMAAGSEAMVSHDVCDVQGR